MGPNVVAIIQARMASSRLPGKVLMDIGGVAMLGRVLERTRLASAVRQVLVATSTEVADDAIEAYGRKHDVAFFRGSHFDVLDRYHSAALSCGAEIVVRITADCPLIDPGLIDITVAALRPGKGGDFEFAANSFAASVEADFPDWPGCGGLHNASIAARVAGGARTRGARARHAVHV